jgi:hypothetical protein
MRIALRFNSEAVMGIVATSEQVAAWRRVIAEQERGDLTQGEFCAKRGLELNTFRNWKYRLARGERRDGVARPDEPVRFVPVRIVDRAADLGSGVELALSGGRVVRVARGFDVETLRRLVEAIETRTC